MIRAGGLSSPVCVYRAARQSDLSSSTMLVPVPGRDSQAQDSCSRIRPSATPEYSAQITVSSSWYVKMVDCPTSPSEEFRTPAKVLPFTEEIRCGRAMFGGVLFMGER